MKVLTERAGAERTRRPAWAWCLGVLCSALIILIGHVGDPVAANAPGRNGSFVVSAGDQIFSGGVAGAEGQQLTEGSASADCPAVSPSGQLIAFCRHPTELPADIDTFEIWIMNSDGSDERLLTSLDGAAFGPSFSSSRPLVAFFFSRDFANSHLYDIYTIRSDGTQSQNLTRSRLWYDYNPTFSPGGHKLLWVRERFGTEQTQLWTMRANGANKHMIRNDNPNISGGDWSPNGRFIVYRSNRSLKIVRPNGTVVRRIARPGATDPTWSPNGHRIAYIHRSREVRIMSTDGSNTRTVAPFWGNPGALERLAWQPIPQ